MSASGDRTAHFNLVIDPRITVNTNITLESSDPTAFTIDDNGNSVTTRTINTDINQNIYHIIYSECGTTSLYRLN